MGAALKIINYPNCCGAYFITELTFDDVKNAPKSLKDIPQVKTPDPWYKDEFNYRYDEKYAPLAYSYLNTPSIAYWITILNKKENELLEGLLPQHNFKLLSKTKDRFLYARCRGVS